MEKHKFSDVLKELRSSITWSDLKLNPETTIIKDTHVLELRKAIENIHKFITGVCPWNEAQCGVVEIYGEIPDPKYDIGVKSKYGMISVYKLNDEVNSYQVRCTRLRSSLESISCGVREMIGIDLIDTDTIDQEFGYWSLSCSDLQSKINEAMQCGVVSATTGDFNGVNVQLLTNDTCVQQYSNSSCPEESCSAYNLEACIPNGSDCTGDCPHQCSTACPIDECPMDSSTLTWNEIFMYNNTLTRNTLYVTCPINISLDSIDRWPVHGIQSVLTTIRSADWIDNQGNAYLVSDNNGRPTSYISLVGDDTVTNPVERKVPRYYGMSNGPWRIQVYEDNNVTLTDAQREDVLRSRRGYWYWHEGLMQTQSSLDHIGTGLILNGERSIWEIKTENNYSDEDGIPGELHMYVTAERGSATRRMPTRIWGSIKTILHGAKSIVSAASRGYKLMNDSTTLDGKVYYGTNYNGEKGFWAVTNGLIQASKSVNQKDNVLFLVGDPDSDVGSMMYYGTNSLGIKGFYPVPGCGVGGRSVSSTSDANNIVSTSALSVYTASLLYNQSEPATSASIVLSDVCSTNFLMS